MMQNDESSCFAPCYLMKCPFPAAFANGTVPPHVHKVLAYPMRSVLLEEKELPSNADLVFYNHEQTYQSDFWYKLHILR